MRFFFLEMLSAKYTMMASFAISEGWNVSTPTLPSQRVAPFSLMPTPGTSTRTSRKMDTYINIFAMPRRR